MSRKRFKLIDIEWPEFGQCSPPARTPATEFEKRIEKTREKMEELGLTHLVVYGDREHFANLAYLSGMDPRFEEALLIMSSTGIPLIVVGIECYDYLHASPLYKLGKLRSECYRTFSLMNMPREGSRFIEEIFRSEGIGKSSKVGCAGWKYYSEAELPDSLHAIDMPSYLVDTLRRLSGYENVVNATGIFIDPDSGLRTYCSVDEIAYFEFTNVLASEGVKRIIFGLREGMTDYELAALSNYNGVPLGCHMTLATGENNAGLASPAGEVIRRGSTLSTNICYWGSNICRAGWIAETAADLPPQAQDYVENFAGEYFEVMCEWLEMLKIGACGGEFAKLISEKLPLNKFGIKLNPGHLIHLDEWVSSPFYQGSNIKLHSGMMIQADIIPYSERYFSTRMEDGLVLADVQLREELRKQYPECYERCMKRREFMINTLGIELNEEVLPLSNIPAIVPPFFLKPNLVFAVH
ncbi:MAG TPA: M24 family metallopeptidase [Clostridiaceae bacterium]|nr:M24 family metallopeptidase [Clostridiaceae bacterium]